MNSLRALPSLLVSVVNGAMSGTARGALLGAVLGVMLLGTLACGDEDEGAKYVDPETVTEASVRAAVTLEVQERLATHAGAPTNLEVELLLHEVRQLEDRDEPSDLVVLWSTWSASGTPEWALGQLYRHRSGDISWRWFDVADPGWLPFHVHDAAPGNDDVLAFLRYWDFEADGQNGELVAGEVKAEAWREVIGEEPPVAYPEGTEAP